MRFKTMMVLAIGILGLPQVVQSANGWADPSANMNPYEGRYGAAMHYDQPAYHGRFRPAAPQRYQALPQAQHRFRAWGRASTNQPQPNQKTHTPRVHPAQSVSYWGGNPAARMRPVTRPAMEAPPRQHVDRRLRPMSGTAHALPQVAGYSGNAQYRFRPLRQETLSQPTGQLRYRPIQVKIPEQAIFRPLNPVAKSMPPAQIPRQQHFMPPPVLPYPSADVGTQRYPYSAKPMPSGRFVYNYPDQRRWSGYRPWTTYGPERGVYNRSAVPRYAQMPTRPLNFRPQPVLGAEMRSPAYRPYRFAQHNLVRPNQRHTYNPGWRSRYPYPAPHYAIRHQYQPVFLGARPQWQPVRSANRRTDWYDGRGDGDGAWYQLVKNTGPVVTQQWSASPVSVEEYSGY